jgi:tetratricopeptide (TPR) repeat protein
MFSNGVRLFIGFIFFLTLILLAYLRLYEFAAVCALMLILLVWDYFKQGTLIIAARYFHHKEYEKAERSLLQIKQPCWLSKNRRGYYEFIMGGICLQKHDFKDAETHYEIAAQYPLRSVNDHVAALVHIANINVRQGNYEKAKAYLQLTDQYKDNVNAKMKEVISRLYEEIKGR